MIFRLLFLVIVLFFSSCSAKAPRFFPKNLIPQSPNATSLLLRKLDQSSKEVSQFRGLFNLELKKKNKKNKFLVTYIFERPDSARITFLFPGINQLSLLLIANKGQLFVKDNSSKKSYYLEASAEALEKYLFVPLELEELMLWSLANYQMPARIISSQHMREADLSYLKIKIEDGRDLMFVVEHLSNSTLRIQKFRIDREERLLFSSNYFYQDQNAKLPSRIEFTLEEESAEGIINYQKQELNPDLSTMRERLFGIEKR